jgi:hypothetical protein
MAAGRKPGPQCAHGNPVAIDDGTMCLAQSPTPGSVGTAIHGQPLAGGVPNRGTSGHSSQGHSDSAIVSGIMGAASWKELERCAEVALGPSSFYLGVCYGILENLAGSVAGLVDLLRIFILAGLYERAQHPSWIVADLPGYLTAKTAQLVFGVQLKKAHDQCETLIRELKYAVTHPGELLGSIKSQYAAKWKRFETLIVDISLSSQFEAGKIAGEVLLDVLMLIGMGEAAVKFAAKLPELAKLAERFEGALKLGARAGGGAVAEEAEAASAGAGRIAAKPPTPGPRPPTVIRIPPNEAPEAVAAWYKQNPRITDENVSTYLKGTDFSKPVMKRPLNPGDRVDVWVRDGGKPGNHFAQPGTDPRTLGIDLEGRHLERYEVTEPIEVMDTAAADFPEGEVSGIGGKGGGRQLITPPGAVKLMRRIGP